MSAVSSFRSFLTLTFFNRSLVSPRSTEEHRRERKGSSDANGLLCVRVMLSANLDWVQLGRQAHFHRTELAQLCHVSPSRLNDFFVQHFHRPPQKWLDEIRLWEAFQKICHGSPVKNVAYDLGFKQVSHFSKAFSRYHGLPPTECRKRYLAREIRRQQFLKKIAADGDIPKSWQLPPVWVQAQQILLFHDRQRDKSDGNTIFLKNSSQG